MRKLYGDLEIVLPRILRLQDYIGFLKLKAEVAYTTGMAWRQKGRDLARMRAWDEIFIIFQSHNTEAFNKYALLLDVAKFLRGYRRR